MVTSGRRAARDVLLLPATQDRGNGDAADSGDLYRDASDPGPGTTHLPVDEGSRLRIIVRHARLLDTLALTRLEPGFELDHPGSSPADCDPVRALLRGAIPLVRAPQSVFVAAAEGSRRVLGYAQSRAVGPDQRWLIQSIGANTGVYDPEPIISELVRHVVQSAGLDGVKRVYARTEPDSLLKPSLRLNGFSAYARERIMVAGSVPEMARAPGVRRQEQSDVWSIHQLYIGTTPREVQYAEALTSHSWDVDAISRSSGHGCAGWVVAEDHLAVGYIRAITRRDAHIVDFMLSPDHRELFPVLISTAFRELASQPARLTWIVVRDYQSEFIPFLYELGFGIERAQEAHIRYTTAPVRPAVVSGIPATKPSREPAGRGVPTYMHSPIDTFSPATGGEAPGEWSHQSRGTIDSGK